MGNGPNKKPIGRAGTTPAFCALEVNTDYSAVFPASELICSTTITTSGGSLEILATASFANNGITNFIGQVFVNGTLIKGFAAAAPNGGGGSPPFRNAGSVLVTPLDVARVLGVLTPGVQTVEFRGSVDEDPAFPPGAIVSINAAAVPAKEHASLSVREV